MPTDSNLDTLAQDVAALTDRFADLGAKLAAAARDLEESGAPPVDALVDALAEARGRFTEVRQEVLGTAQALGLPVPDGTESVKSLEPLLAAARQEIAARERRAALEAAQQAALAVLDRALAISHQDDPAFATLVACHGKARAEHEAIAAVDDPDAPEAQTLTERVRPFADLLTIVESRDALDDDQYAQLEESVVRAFGRPLAVAAARGRLVLPGMARPAPAPAPPPEPVVEAPPPVVEPPPPVVEAPPAVEEAPAVVEPLRLEREVAPPPEPIAPAEPEEAEGEAGAPDETAQWWLAAWARWSGWKGSLSFADAVREELGKYPYLLAVPIQRSTDYEDGLLAYGYSIVLEHVEKQKPGCVNNALNSLRPGQARPAGDQLYDYLVTEGRLGETYAEFVKNVLLALLPEPGVWYQSRILEGKDDTRIIQRASDRLGETDQVGKRLSADSARFTEHKLALALQPLTARFVLVSCDLKDNRGLDVRLSVNGAASDAAWLVTVPSAGRASAKIEAKRLAAEGTPMPGLGKDYAALWIALFNPDPREDGRYELGLGLKKDARAAARKTG